MADNILSITQWLEDKVRDVLDFTKDGFGEDVLDLMAEDIQDRCRNQLAPDGTTWPDNEPRYAARKGGLPVGELTGEMLDINQIKGQRTIEPQTVEMEYGVSEFAIQKAGWFTDGDTSLNRPERPFYEIDEMMEQRIYDRCQDEIDRRCENASLEAD